MGGRFLVIGAGIAGLAAAVELVSSAEEIVVADSADRVGGKLRSSVFAGIDGIDEGADAYLTRVTPAVELAAAVGVGTLKHPTSTHAAVLNRGLHRLPAGIVLGVPASLRPLATTRLLSWRGKLRALGDLVLPRTPTDDDRIGALVRARFGDEVQERLIDSLIGSIYAADTDDYSLTAVPQLAALAAGRSLTLSARSQARQRPKGDDKAPIFAAPANGMEQLARSTHEWLLQHGATVLLGSDVSSIEPSGNGWNATLAGTAERFDGVVIATPSAPAAELLRAAGLGTAADLVAGITAADVTMVRLRIPASQWPGRLRGLSGYLVPKPDQRWVTAASFGSQKWSEWRPDNGDEILRVSLGRDGLRVDHLADDEVTHFAVDDINRHLDIDLSPSESSITRWREGFPQYRPHHWRRLEQIDQALPTGLAVAGASYRGIGIPACVASGRRAARFVLTADARD